MLVLYSGSIKKYIVCHNLTGLCSYCADLYSIPHHHPDITQYLIVLALKFFLDLPAYKAYFYDIYGKIFYLVHYETTFCHPLPF